jgi:hypothetical protein
MDHVWTMWVIGEGSSLAKVYLSKNNLATVPCTEHGIGGKVA